ncbi:MAG: phosphatase PAP2 family protein [Flavobacterium sp.]|nr:phosphatase PAP2 family protein [Aeromicrobium sp.]
MCLSVAVGLTAIIFSQRLNVPLRDPDGFLGPAYIRLPFIGLLFFAVGVIPVALKRAGVRGAVHEARRIVREEWSWKRVLYIATGLISFYVCYVSYRNLKSDLPVVRNVHFDKQMLDIDYFLFFGHNPAPVLHNLLGTGVSAQVLSIIYVAYLPLIPLTLGAFLVWGKDVSVGAWYATALSLNWVLGVVSYYAVPTLGPAFVQQSMFTDLPDTSAATLQRGLFHAATRFYDDPSGGSTYGIAGFASLHVSVVVSACLFLRLTKQRKLVQTVAWVYLGLVVLATIYFGWHYLADDVAGAFIGWAAVVIGAWATGNTKWQRRRREKELLPPATDVEPAVEPAS